MNEKNEKNLVKNNSDFLFDLTRRFLQYAQDKDLDEIQKFTADYLQDLLAKDPLDQITNLSKFFDLIIPYTLPLFINEQFNPKHPINALLKEPIKSELQNRHYIFAALNEVYNNSFATILEGAEQNPSDSYYLANKMRHLDAVGGKFWDKPKEDITIKDLLGVFTYWYEILYSTIIIAAKTLHLKLRGTEMAEPNFKEAKDLFKEVNPKFFRIYYKFVRAEFRHKYAHLDWTPLENGCFSIIVDGQERQFDRAALKNAILNLLAFFIGFSDLFMFKPLKSKIQSAQKQLALIHRLIQTQKQQRQGEKNGH
ncbi:MAG: hypothetical protein ACTSQI_18425 [Candidatus Helarchaeota archaeon]